MFNDFNVKIEKEFENLKMSFHRGGLKIRQQKEEL
jgi:hypothetical protein